MQETPRERRPPWGSRQARPGQYLPQGHPHVKRPQLPRGPETRTRAQNRRAGEQALLGVRRQEEIPGAGVNSGPGGGLREFTPRASRPSTAMRPVPCKVREPGGQGAQGRDCIGLRVRTERGNQDQGVRRSPEPHRLLNKDSECRGGCHEHDGVRLLPETCI